MITGELDGFLNGMWKVVHDSGELAGAVTTYDITGLDGDTDVEYQLLLRTVNGVASTVNYAIRFNNDSGSNYGFQRTSGQDSTASAARYTTGTGINVGYMTGMSIGLLAFTNIHIFAKSGKERTAIQSVAEAITGTTVNSINKLAHSWNNTADNMTSINIVGSVASCLGVGSRIILLKKTHAEDGVETGELFPANLPGVWERISEIELSTIETSQTKLLATFQGADGATTGTAETGQTITFAGTAQLDDAQAKIGKTSLLLDGNSDYITVPDSTDWHFGAEDFTIDFWVRFNDLTGVGNVIQFVFQIGSPYGGFAIRYVTSTKKLNFYATTNAAGNVIFKYDSTNTWEPVVDTWYHLAFERASTTCKVFIDGVEHQLTESTTISGKTIEDYPTVFTIGADTKNSIGYLNGYLDGFRITKGKALWVEDFTPPTAYGCANAVVIGDLAGDTDVIYNAIVRFVNADASNAVAINLRLNADSGSNYGRQMLNATNTTVSASRDVITSIDLTYTVAGAGRLGLGNMLLYCKSGYVRTAIVEIVKDINGTTVETVRLTGNSWNDSVQEVVAMSIMPNQVNALGVGTSIELYKLNL